MILPRLQIKKLLVQIHNAIEEKKIIHLVWNDKVVCVDGIKRRVYSSVRPNFLPATLFLYYKISDDIWKFEPCLVYRQLTGLEISSNYNINYLIARYRLIDERLSAYVDTIINI